MSKKSGKKRKGKNRPTVISPGDDGGKRIWEIKLSLELPSEKKIRKLVHGFAEAVKEEAPKLPRFRANRLEE